MDPSITPSYYLISPAWVVPGEVENRFGNVEALTREQIIARFMSEPDENSAAAGKDTTVLAFRDKVQATAVTKDSDSAAAVKESSVKKEVADGSANDKKDDQ